MVEPPLLFAENTKVLCSEIYLEERRRRGEGEDWLPCDLKIIMLYIYVIILFCHSFPTWIEGAGRFYWPVDTSGSCL